MALFQPAFPPRFDEDGDLGETVRKLIDSQFLLNERLTYVFTHLGQENFSPGALRGLSGGDEE